MAEARLAQDELNLTVRVTKKGFCLGVVAAWALRPPKDPFQSPESKADDACRPVGKPPDAAGRYDVESLTQFLSEAQSKNGKRLRVTVTAEPDVPRDDLRKVMKAMRATAPVKATTRGQQAGAANGALLDLAVTEGSDGL